MLGYKVFYSTENAFYVKDKFGNYRMLGNKYMLPDSKKLKFGSDVVMAIIFLII